MSTTEEPKGAHSTVEKVVDTVRVAVSHPSTNEQSTNTNLQADVAEVKVVTGSEAYNEALIKEAPPLWHWTTWKLFGCLLLGCFAQTMVSNSLHLASATAIANL
jgi:hypothetical protein